MTLPLFSIIIPTIGKTGLLESCIKSLRKYEKNYQDYEIIVIDDGSKPKDSLEIMKKSNVYDFLVIKNNKNLGFSKSINKAIDYSKGRFVVLCNNDIEFTKPFLANFRKAFESHSRIGIVGARLYYPDGRIQHAGMEYDAPHKRFIHINRDVSTSKYVIATTGALMAIDIAVLSQIGKLDDNYFLACEDTEFCLRAWKVGIATYYSSDVEAIHHEGATRGRTQQQKLIKGRDWMAKENQSIQHFKKMLPRYTAKRLVDQVEALNVDKNAVGKKIEVGSGFNPHPGYLHLDVRKGLPDLDYVCDFSKEKLPFRDSSIEEILANHVIEHISFRKLPHVVGEWARVLKLGGKLVLRTPDLRFIVQRYLSEDTTPEWPGDEDFIRKHLSDEVTPSWWANLKLFSGQDYEANFHHVCFDFEMLKSLLERYGFVSVTRTKFDREFSPGELQVKAYKGEKPGVIVVRRGAIGDVLLMTPVLKRLAEDYKVTVATDTPDAVMNLPFVEEIVPWDCGAKETYGKVINLDSAYENDPKRHIINAYAKVVFGDQAVYHKLYYQVTAEEVHKTYTREHDQFIAIHPTQSWANRTWPKEKWEELINLLTKRNDYKIVLVGNDADLRPDVKVWKTYQGKLSWRETAAVIAKARVFVGMDSSLLHVAQALDVRSVGIFTCAKAGYRKTSEKCLPIVPDLDCYGCLHDEAPPVVYCDCRRGDLKCLEVIDMDELVDAIERSYR